MKPALTVIIPTFNEENHIEQALFSASFADETLVIDSFSTDSTAEIVRASGTRLLERNFDNFSAQKNYAIAQAKNDWILILDADEYLSYNLQQEISRKLLEADEKTTFFFPFKNHFINRFIHFGTNGNNKKARLFHRRSCHYEGLVHEQLICEGTSESIPLPILHYTYKSLDHFLGKKNSYSSLQAEQIIRKNKKVGAFHFIVKPGFRYLNELVLRLGFLDGVAGLTSTAMNGYGVLSRYVKAENKRNRWKSESLRNYESFTAKLLEEAKIEGRARDKNESIAKSDFLLKPLGAFLKTYFVEKEYRKGLEGYIISYLKGFKSFNVILRHWLHKRDLE